MTLSKDFLAGLIFLLIGLGVVVEAQGYPMGSLLRMGPGFFPTMVGGLMALVGAALIGKAVVRRPTDRPSLSAGPAALILIGILAFAYALDRLGLVIATVLLVTITRLASRPVRWLGTLALSAALAAIAIVIFWYLLGLPLRLWPR